MKFQSLVFLMLIAIGSYAQKNILIEEHEKVAAQATIELDEAMKGPEGELFLFKQESGITGVYDFDITLHEKGKVATVFVKGNEGGTIKLQNQLKDFVKEMKFNFKMPKGKDYKFSYTFNFNE